MGMSMLDFIIAEAQPKDELTLEQWTYIRNNGTPEEIEEAVSQMEAQGGYGNLG